MVSFPYNVPAIQWACKQDWLFPKTFKPLSFLVSVVTDKNTNPHPSSNQLMFASSLHILVVCVFHSFSQSYKAPKVWWRFRHAKYRIVTREGCHTLVLHRLSNGEWPYKKRGLDIPAADATQAARFVRLTTIQTTPPSLPTWRITRFKIYCCRTTYYLKSHSYMFL